MTMWYRLVTSDHSHWLPAPVPVPTRTYSRHWYLAIPQVTVLPPPKSICPWVMPRYVPYLLRPWVHPHATLHAPAATFLAASLPPACCSAARALAAGPPCALIACPLHAPLLHSTTMCNCSCTCHAALRLPRTCAWGRR